MAGYRYTVLMLCAVSALCGAEAGSRENRTETQTLRKLLAVESVYVEDLNGEASAAMRDMIISALQQRGLFRLTEDPALADAFLRGSAEDLIYQDLERYRQSMTARGAASASRRESGESRYNSNSFGIGDTEDSELRERRHEAIAAVRLVLRNGEVIWATTQESNGAKYRGSAHDVAERVADDLARSVMRARTLALRP